jgi:type IV secretory pathway VirB2 component (pilin)
VSVAPSLFDAPAAPVLPSAAGWVTGTLFGDVAASLCVIAVAIMGILLMTGRLSVRDAARVVIGCFVLLGAPLIAAGLRSAADNARTAPAIEAAAVVPGPLPTAN